MQLFIRIIRSWWGFRWIRFVIFFFVGGVLGAGGLYAMGWYPIMFVDSVPIYAYQYRTSLVLAHNFYDTLQTRMHIQAPQDQELQKVVFDGLVDNFLINRALEQQMSVSDLKQKVEARVTSMISTPEALQSALTATHMSEANTRTYFLDPLARQQILEELFLLKQKDLSQWLLQARESVYVSLWTVSGYWSGKTGYVLK